MYGRVRTGTSLLSLAARATPCHGRGLESLVLAGCPTPAEGDPRPASPHSQDMSPFAIPAAPHGTSLSACRVSAWLPLSLQASASFASKGARPGREGKGAAAAAAGSYGWEDPDFDLAPFVSQMRSALEHLQRELASIRTGRASPGLLESVTVADSSRGPHVPLRALGTVVVRNPHLLVVEVYEEEDAQKVANAVQNSPLKLQARCEGNEVLVTMPRLNLDMVERMARLASQEAEAARIEVRRARHRARELVKKLAGAGGVNAMDTRRREDRIQAATDTHVAEIDAMLKAKVKDLRENH